MKASKFSDAQKAFILKQGNDGVPVADICRKAGISQATYFNWKRKYEGMQPEMRRLKQLEDENSKLKKIVADSARWIARCPTSSAENCGGLPASASWRRRFVMNGTSIRRACSVLEFDRSTYHYNRVVASRSSAGSRIARFCRTRPLRLPAGPCPPASRRLGDQFEEDVNLIYNELGLQLRNNAKEKGLKGATQLPHPRSGLWTSSMTNWPMSEGPRPDRRRYVQPVLARHRCKVHSIGPEDRVANLRTRLCSHGLSEDDQWSTVIRVREPTRLLGLCEGRQLTSQGQEKLTDNASSSKRVQRASRAEAQRALVPDACRRPRKVEDCRVLHPGDRPHGAIGNKTPGRLHDLPARPAPASASRSRKPQFPAVQRCSRGRPTTPSSRRSTGAFRALEYLNAHWFPTLADAQA